MRCKQAQDAIVHRSRVLVFALCALAIFACGRIRYRVIEPDGGPDLDSSALEASAIDSQTGVARSDAAIDAPLDSGADSAADSRFDSTLPDATRADAATDSGTPDSAPPDSGPARFVEGVLVIDPTGDSRSMDVELDATGGGVVVGIFSGQMNLGPVGNATAMGEDGVILGFDQAARPTWMAPFVAPGNGFFWNVAVAPNGDSFAVGGIGSPTSPGLEAPFGMVDGLIVAHDRTGRMLWHHRIGGAGDDLAENIVRDEATGDLIVVGKTASSTITFDATNGDAVSVSDMTAYIARYTSLGRVVWAHAVRSTAGGYIHGLGFANGRACGSGEGTNLRYGTADIPFGMPSLRSSLSAMAFCVGGGGALTWATTFDAPGFFLGGGVDNDGNSYASGPLADDFDLGAGRVDFGRSGQDAVVASFDPSGQVRWVRRGGVTTGALTGRMHVAGNRVVAFGITQNPITWESALPAVPPGSFYVIFDVAGNLVRLGGLGSPSVAIQAESGQLLPDGTLLLAGQVNGTGFAHAAPFNATNAMYVMRITP